MAIIASNPSEPISRLDSLYPYEDPYVIRFKPCYGWTRCITVLDDHRLFNRFPEFRSWTSAEHVTTAEHAVHASVILHRAYADLVTLALTTYGDQGSLISGVVRDHFPNVVKDQLRQTIRLANRESARSLAHWKAAGKRFTTWTYLRDSTRTVLGGDK